MSEAYRALETQLEMLRFYNSASGARFLGLDMAGGEPDARRSCERIVETLMVAGTYFVSHEIQQVILGGLESLPNEASVGEDLLPTPGGFVLFEKPIALPLTTSRMEMPLRGFSWYPARRETDPEDGGATMLSFDFFSTLGPTGDRVPPQLTAGLTWPFGMSVEQIIEDFTELRTRGAYNRAELAKTGVSYDDDEWEDARVRMDARVLKLVRIATATLHFMNQRLVTLAQERPPRALRRRLEHEEQPERSIRVIVLRAKDHRDRQPQGLDGDGDSAGRWGVRSIRRAHWHHYWCGGKSHECLQPGHTDSVLELRWLDATVCGPDGAPLKRAHDLFSVSR